MDTLFESALKFHIYSVIGVVFMMTAFYLFTQYTNNFDVYKRRIRMWMPIYILALAFTVFTGILMMASKHLSFNLSNNLMIALTLLIVTLELKRHKRLQAATQADPQLFRFIKLIYAVEFLSSFGLVYLLKANIL